MAKDQSDILKEILKQSKNPKALERAQSELADASKRKAEIVAEMKGSISAPIARSTTGLTEVPKETGRSEVVNAKISENLTNLIKESKDQNTNLKKIIKLNEKSIEDNSELFGRLEKTMNALLNSVSEQGRKEGRFGGKGADTGGVESSNKNKPDDGKNPFLEKIKDMLGIGAGATATKALSKSGAAPAANAAANANKPSNLGRAGRAVRGGVLGGLAGGGIAGLLGDDVLGEYGAAALEIGGAAAGSAYDVYKGEKARKEANAAAETPKKVEPPKVEPPKVVEPPKPVIEPVKPVESGFKKNMSEITSDRYKFNEKTGRYHDTMKGVGGGQMISDAKASELGLEKPKPGQAKVEAPKTLEVGKTPTTAPPTAEPSPTKPTTTTPPKVEPAPTSAPPKSTPTTTTPKIEAPTSAPPKGGGVSAGKTMGVIGTIYAIWEVGSQIYKLDSKSMPLEDYSKQVTTIVAKAVAEFGLVWVGAILGGMILTAAFPGVGTIVGVIAGGASGFLAQYAFGGTVDDLVEKIVTKLYEGGKKDSMISSKQQQTPGAGDVVDTSTDEEEIYKSLTKDLPENFKNDVSVQQDYRSEAKITAKANAKKASSQKTSGTITPRDGESASMFETRKQLAEEQQKQENKTDTIVKEFAEKMGIDPNKISGSELVAGVPIQINGVVVPKELYSAEQIKKIDQANQMKAQMSGQGQVTTPIPERIIKSKSQKATTEKPKVEAPKFDIDAITSKQLEGENQDYTKDIVPGDTQTVPVPPTADQGAQGQTEAVKKADAKAQMIGGQQPGTNQAPIIVKQGDTINQVTNNNTSGGNSGGVGSPSRVPSPWDALTLGKSWEAYP